MIYVVLATINSMMMICDAGGTVETRTESLDIKMFFMIFDAGGTVETRTKSLNIEPPGNYS